MSGVMVTYQDTWSAEALFCQCQKPIKLLVWICGSYVGGENQDPVHRAANCLHMLCTIVGDVFKLTVFVVEYSDATMTLWPFSTGWCVCIVLLPLVCGRNGDLVSVRHNISTLWISSLTTFSLSGSNPHTFQLPSIICCCLAWKAARQSGKFGLSVHSVGSVSAFVAALAFPVVVVVPCVVDFELNSGGTLVCTLMCSVV